MLQLLQELKQRNVFRAGLAYLALAWLVIQITDMAVPALNLPESLHSIVFYLGLIGFPFALLLAWAFELTPEGIKRSENVTEEESIRRETGRKIERVVLFLVAITLCFVVWDAYLSEPEPITRPTITEEEIKIPAPDTQQPNSIAVLPFANMSDDKDYFADGLSEELLNLLAKIPGLKVAGRTSSFAFKGRNEDLRLIGETLGVNTILEGSVRKSGSRIRITAQLIKVEDGFHIWSETYDREMDDIFQIQDEISAAITRELKIHLAADRPERRLPTTNMQAYQLFLEAKPLMAGFTTLYESEEMLLNAVALAPDFAEAWEALAMVNNTKGAYGLVPWSQAEKDIRRYAATAFSIDPELPMASLISGDIDDSDWESKIATRLAVIARFPNAIRAYDWLGTSFMSLGYFQRALEVYNRALTVDPLYPDLQIERAVALDATGQRARAIETYLSWSQVVGLPTVRLLVALLELKEGREEQALVQIENYATITGADRADVEEYVRKLFNPVGRELLFDDPRWQQYMSLPDERGITRARLYMYLDDPAFWGALEVVRDAGGGGNFRPHIIGNYRHHSFLNDSQFRQHATADGRVEYWQKHGLPDFCAEGYESWICELPVNTNIISATAPQ